MNLNINLIDLFYSAVLGYGLTKLDVAHPNYFFLAFTAVIFFVDWIYIHRILNDYWKEHYGKVCFFLDFLIVSVMAMLFKYSSESPGSYIACLAVLFSIYVAWDITAAVKTKKLKVDFPYSWEMQTFADIGAAIAYWIIFLVRKNSFVLSVSCYAVISVVYAAAVILWHINPKYDQLFKIKIGKRRK